MATTPATRRVAKPPNRHYFSPRYAESVCQQYIGLGLFSTAVPLEEAS
jgi:hypothetical protein